MDSNMPLTRLRETVCNANLELQTRGLVICSWGNVSGIDRTTGTVVIKPSGMEYDALTPDNLAAVDLDGNILTGEFKPSSDTPTHLELYRRFPQIGGICHTHSNSATMWAQAAREIPCFGTTHADYFYGAVPVTEPMTDAEIDTDYELNTGRVIARRLAEIDPLSMRAVLVASHGPFTWGLTAAEAVESAVVLEEIAAIALGTITIDPAKAGITRTLLDKHYLRKHGKNAYYGQR